MVLGPAGADLPRRAVFRRLACVLDEDEDEEVHDAAYDALLRLAAAPEETAE